MAQLRQLGIKKQPSMAYDTLIQKDFSPKHFDHPSSRKHNPYIYNVLKRKKKKKKRGKERRGEGEKGKRRW